jgi:hypothetical protein
MEQVRERILIKTIQFVSKIMFSPAVNGEEYKCVAKLTDLAELLHFPRNTYPCDFRYPVKSEIIVWFRNRYKPITNNKNNLILSFTKKKSKQIICSFLHFTKVQKVENYCIILGILQWRIQDFVI